MNVVCFSHLGVWLFPPLAHARITRRVSDTAEVWNTEIKENYINFTVTELSREQFNINFEIRGGNERLYRQTSSEIEISMSRY